MFSARRTNPCASPHGANIRAGGDGIPHHAVGAANLGGHADASARSGRTDPRAHVAPAHEWTRGARILPVGSTGIESVTCASRRTRATHATACARQANEGTRHRCVDPHPGHASLNSATHALRGAGSAYPRAHSHRANGGTQRTFVRPEPTGIADLWLVPAALSRSRHASSGAGAVFANEGTHLSVSPRSIGVARLQARHVATLRCRRADAPATGRRADKRANRAGVPRSIRLAGEERSAVAPRRSRATRSDASAVRT